MKKNNDNYILAVDDDNIILDLVRDVCSMDNINVVTSNNAKNALDIFSKKNITTAILDIRIGNDSGIELAEKLVQLKPTLPIIFITGYPSKNYKKAFKKIENCLFLTKPFSPEQLRFAIKGTISKNEKYNSTEHIKTHAHLAGKSSYIKSIMQKIKNIANTNFSVIVTGPSGSGKDVVSRLIHENSQRKNKPFVAINCGALPENLIESELFGHVKGAFTGAQHDKKGLIATANGGTLFLDEIGDLPLSMQVKFLRVIEQKEFYRIGDTTPQTVDIRIIAATNRNFEEELKKGTFRKDLYYRLNGDTIELLPLKNHTEDIPDLIVYFARLFSPDKKISIDNNVITRAINHSWHGDIRELKTFMMRLIYDAKKNGTVSSTILDYYLPQDNESNNNNHIKPFRVEKKAFVENFEKKYFSKLLKMYNGNINQVSKIAEIERRNLVHKLKSLNISPDDFRGV